MYFYIYDRFLSDKKYDRALAAIETRLTDLGISGKIGRLAPLTTAKGLIRDEVRRGAQTIVVVGSDDTVAEVVENLGDAKITLGFIPVGSPAEIAKSLGIPDGVAACDVLSKRLTQKIDMGLVNGRLFLSEVRIPEARVVIEADGRYRVSARTQCEIIVSNLRTPDMAPASGDAESSGAPGDPQDGFLDAIVVPKSGGIFRFFQNLSLAPSVIPMRKIFITSPQPIPVFADGRKFVNKSISIEVVPERLKVITGRERVFA